MLGYVRMHGAAAPRHAFRQPGVLSGGQVRIRVVVRMRMASLHKFVHAGHAYSRWYYYI